MKIAIMAVYTIVVLLIIGMIGALIGNATIAFVAGMILGVPAFFGGVELHDRL